MFWRARHPRANGCGVGCGLNVRLPASRAPRGIGGAPPNASSPWRNYTGNRVHHHFETPSTMAWIRNSHRWWCSSSGGWHVWLCPLRDPTSPPAFHRRAALAAEHFVPLCLRTRRAIAANAHELHLARFKQLVRVIGTVAAFFRQRTCTLSHVAASVPFFEVKAAGVSCGQASNHRGVKTVGTQTIYLAGPDVFRPNAVAWGRAQVELCAEYGFHAVFPLDADAGVPTARHDLAKGIYKANVAVIDRCDVVVANLDFFRGAEPDSGTCFEVGYAIAREKPVVGYIPDRGTLATRIRRRLPPAVRRGDATVDANGWRVEDLGLALNLMLAVPCHIVVGDLGAALDFLCAMTANCGEPAPSTAPQASD